MAESKQKKKKHPLLQLVAGGTAGFVESTICHPLDTIKTRMQLRRQQSTLKAIRARSSLQEPGAIRSMSSLADPSISGLQLTSHSRTISKAPLSAVGSSSSVLSPSGRTVTASLGPIGTARRIVEREGFMSLYKGLTAVYCGIIPKMAIRFLSFEQYREMIQKLVGPQTKNNGGSEFLPSVTLSAGLMSGLTEAILIVTPAEVCKIRMQSQYHSLMDPTQMARRKYTNVVQTAITIVKEEGFTALYKGIVPTMMRQGCNQAVNFSMYHLFKAKLLEMQKKSELSPGESLLLGGISGGLGPLVNNPLDVVKTRMQKQVIKPGTELKYKGVFQAVALIAREEGYFALWKGISPRLLRIVPGQAITFMTYEAVSSALTSNGFFL